MFKAVGTLYRQRYENPKVEDDEGRLATSPNDILKLTTNFFKAKFQKEDAEVIQPFEDEPRPLVKEVTTEEIHKSLTKLNNNKATGEDDIPGELLKYSPKEVKEYIAKMINDMFRKHEPLKINNGNMRAIQKPNKPKGPRKNLRPVTLLNTIRKELSICTLNGTGDEIGAYLSVNQSGFRPFRSTSDIVRTHR